MYGAKRTGPDSKNPKGFPMKKRGIEEPKSKWKAALAPSGVDCRPRLEMAGFLQ